MDGRDVGKIAARRTRLAAAWLSFLAAVTAGGCAAKYAADDFPKGSTAAAAMEIRWTGTLVGIRHGAPEPGRQVVHLGGGERWTLVFRISEASTQIPPFVVKKKVTLAVADPLVFLGSNNVSVGAVISKAFAVWRGTDGLLYAAVVEKTTAPNPQTPAGP